MSKAEYQIADDSPVTILATHRVKPGKEKAFERSMSHLIQAAIQYEGHLGANVLRPTDPSDPQYTIVFKFDHLENLQRWEQSEIRQVWLRHIAELTQAQTPIQVLSGLESWFTLPVQRSTVPPPRYKMALVTWIAVFPVVLIINTFLGDFFATLPFVLRSFVFSAMFVLLMTYIVMPRMTRLFKRWLYPKSLP